MLALTLYCDQLTIINSNIIHFYLYWWLVSQPIIHRPYLSCKQGQNISENFNLLLFLLFLQNLQCQKKRKWKLNNSLVVKSSQETKELNVLLKVRVTQLPHCAERNQASTSTFKPESNAHQLSGGFIDGAAKCFWI